MREHKRLASIPIALLVSATLSFAAPSTNTIYSYPVQSKPCNDIPNTTSTWLEYYFHDNTLFLHHVNARFNCAVYSFRIETFFSNNTLFINEIGKMDSIAGCGCYFDLTFKIPNIKMASFKITINQTKDELYPNSISGYIDLNECSSGAIRLDNVPMVGRVPSFSIK